MRSRADMPRLLAALLLGALAHGALAALPVPPGTQPTQAQVREAAEQMRADPALSHERQIRVLKWKSPEQEDEHESRDEPAWIRWLRGLFGFLGSAGRAVVWILAGILAAMLVAFILRVVRERGPASRGRAFEAPTHVRGLDIRPEALPDDIGAAARSLWDGGDHRAALSLLYRGLLSRLAHVHQVPVRESSTEGECVALAAQRLAGASTAYTERLVATWQRAIYGGLPPAADTVHELCEQFAPRLAAQDAAP